MKKYRFEKQLYVCLVFLLFIICSLLQGCTNANLIHVNHGVDISKNIIMKEGKYKKEWAQDSCLYGDYLFRFKDNGYCAIYNSTTGKNIYNSLMNFYSKDIPHCNSACFGNRYYSDSDFFPLLYINLFNSCSLDVNKNGVCYVCRVQKDENKFIIDLVQVIHIDFVTNNLWNSNGRSNNSFGNFIVDTENNNIIAYVPQDDEQITRFFVIKIPEINQENIVDYKNISLENVLYYFEVPYMHNIQGCCFYNGFVFTIEGFSKDNDNTPALRVINLDDRKELYYVDLSVVGISIEPESIFVEENELVIFDAPGNNYVLYLDFIK